VKAFALTAENQPASLTDLPDPELAPDAALIRIHAASVNGFDVYQASGGLMAMMPHELPTVVGRDFSGVVEAVGRMSPPATRSSGSSRVLRPCISARGRKRSPAAPSSSWPASRPASTG
jgi:NADPH:quinone reductase-like Zn-dependent oxidoreductase